MSPTFSNQPILPEAPAAEPSPLVTSPLSERTDETILHRFRESGNTAAVLAALERDFGLELTLPFLLWARTAFTTLRRDPTAGELRLLSALAHEGEQEGHRLAVNRLYTDDGHIAQAWAAMMDRHAALHAHAPHSPRAPYEHSAPPCTLSACLSLSGDYLRALGNDPIRRRGSDTVRICVPASALPAALAEGFSPLSRFFAEDGERVVCQRVGPALREAGERAGDLLLLSRRVPAEAVERLMAGQRASAHPQLAAIRALAGISLMDGVLSLCHAAELYAGRADPAGAPHALRGRVDTPLLTRPLSPEADGTSDYLMRVSVTNVRPLSKSLQDLGVSAVVLGQVRANDRTVIHIPDGKSQRDIPCADLPAEVLAAAPGVTRHTYTLTNAPSPEGYTLTRHALSRLPSARSAEGGVTPEGYEALALTAAERPLLALPEAGSVAHGVTARVHDPDSAFHAAEEALEAALRPLSEAGVPMESLFVSLSVTAIRREGRPTEALPALLCGVNRRLEELGVAAKDSHLTLLPAPAPRGEPAPVATLSVTVLGRLPAGMPADFTQWQRFTPAAEASPALLPVLRPSREGCVRGVAAALGTVGIPCTLCPLAVTQTEEEGSRIHPDSLAALSGHLATADPIVLAMAEEEARLLLSHRVLLTAITERVASGARLLILGEACRAAAEVELLPAELAAPAAILPASGPLTVTYARPRTLSVRRMVRASLLCLPLSAPLPHLMTLHAADGDIPDGFLGCEGRALGLLNGLDAATAALLAGGDLSPLGDESDGF